MDGETLLKMDSYMALSITNMKLRDEFHNLQEFSSYYNMNIEDLINKFSSVNYVYDVKLNQFISSF